MQFEALTDKGLVRNDNEDNYFASAERGLFVVADGMGGHLAGKVASSLAIQTIEDALNSKNWDEPAAELRKLLYKANDLVMLKSRLIKEYAGMGTTLTAALFANGNIYLAHIGDSRAYLYRSMELQQLTQDHSLVNEMYQKGGITYEEMLNHPQRNILTRALGAGTDIQLEEEDFPVLPGDLLLLCTDGLHGYVDYQKIKSVLGENISLKEKLLKLKGLAYDKGGADNITAILVQCV